MAHYFKKHPSKKHSSKVRIGILRAVVCILCSFILISKLFFLQIVQGDKYKQMALNQQLKDTVMEPLCGSITVSFSC